MKEWIAKYQKAIVGTGAVSVLLICYFQQKELSKLRSEHVKVYPIPHNVDSLINLKDSLHAENYPCQIELNRYQIAYEIFMERNPKAAKQYGTIISEETE